MPRDRENSFSAKLLPRIRSRVFFRYAFSLNGIRFLFEYLREEPR
jgi:hypothetical protein